jgi:hypothetical protein
VNLDALPYTSFIVIMEFAVGSLLVCLIAGWRGNVAPSFIKFSASMVAASAALLLLNLLALDPRSVIGGYDLQEDARVWVQGTSIAFFAASMLYAFFVLREDKPRIRDAGILSVITGAALVASAAYYVSLPTWGYAGALSSIAAGTLSVGAVVLAMTLGHWYLVTPRLPRRPLEELTLLLVAAVIVQALLLIVNVSIPARDTPDATAFLGSTTLGANPAFWLRIAIGLAFPAALGWMSHVSSKGYPQNEMAMMSATGLLYIAVGAVLVGEVLARGLMFLTGVPV